MSARTKGRERIGSIACERKRYVRVVERADLASSSAIIIGTIVDIDPAGAPMVSIPGKSIQVVVARSLVAIDSTALGRQVALALGGGHLTTPLILGVLQVPSPPVASQCDRPSAEMTLHRATQHVEAQVDDERITLTAKKEIVLRCGEASITLTRAGKVLIRGAYVLSDSSTVNRIRGGSVEIN